VLKVDDIKCLLIPDNEKTVELLDEIYKVIERMNPNIKDLTAFTELLTELKQEVSVEQFKNGFSLGVRTVLEENEEVPNIQA
jgi:hypothetical protein